MRFDCALIGMITIFPVSMSQHLGCLVNYTILLQEMKQELVDFKDVISSLQLLSKKVSPVKQRKAKTKAKVPVKAVCSYKNMQVN